MCNAGEQTYLKDIEMKKRICDNCTQKETCHLLTTIMNDGTLSDFFSGYADDLPLRRGIDDLALACKFYEEDND